MRKLLESDADLFTAALSQSTVSVWQTDAVGVYCEVERGIIEKFTKSSIQLSTKSDTISIYYRDDGTLFQVEL
ncbi:hypothetical protein [Paenibacillus whitsoniae]|uniref:Uncharacterized protein n=1 Tax=Paenibacillus whitsoniae TaxID=2496558 RepID=A0A3S0CQ86_9BACL|nr:hypothetical protein [Paenibacillus whitsoniae]RTE02989.1 hypothetical protein EJQ19_28545 [Paenibacillus whitsoniae]